MLNKQNQTADGGSVAIQSERDVNLTIHASMTEDDFKKVLHIIKAQLDLYQQFATAELDRRINQFEEKIVRRFYMDGTDAKRESLADPDVQASFIEATKAASRTSDLETYDILVEILSSRTTSENKRAIILRNSINTVGELDNIDRAVLSFIFFLRNVKIRILDKNLILGQLKRLVELLPELTKATSLTADHLDSVRCIRKDITEIGFWDLLHAQYADAFAEGHNIFSKPINVAAYDAPFKKLGIQSFDVGIIRIPRNGKTAVQSLIDAGADPVLAARDFANYDSGVPDPQTLKSIFIQQIPTFGILENTWNDAELKHSLLSPIGIAIAHSVLKLRMGLDASIKIWLPD